MMNSGRFTGILTVAAILTAGAGARAAINQDQVLVVYNSAITDGDDVYDYYKTVRPGVVGIDLADASVTPGNISYVDYEAKIASKIRTYLTDPLHPTRAANTAVITLTKGIPHRIQDFDLVNPNAGDDPTGQATTKILNNVATFATVDSELSLVLQDLRSGSPGTSMGTKSNNLVTNPYHRETNSFTSFDRSVVKTAATFNNVNAGSFRLWQMSDNPGYLYLTTRLDGYSVQNVKDMIDRSSVPIQYNQNTDKIILDSNGSNLDDGDYAATTTYLSTRYANVRSDTSGTFLIGNTGTAPASPVVSERIPGNIAMLASYGGNHSGSSESGYLSTFNGQLVDGAIMNTLESYNARDFGGIGGSSDQGQLALWVQLGGTFGTGNAWEPFSFSVADNEMLVQNFMFNGLTWAEAAWSSIPFLSWQQVVIGDPLATAIVVVPEPGSALLVVVGLALLARRRRYKAATIGRSL